jgi:hypothetical protein
MLLLPIWRGIDPSYKSKYRSSIWQQFEDNIRSAAYTNSLAKWLSVMTQRLNITIQARDVMSVTQVSSAGMDSALLQMLRNDTTLLVLYVRKINEEKKERFERVMTADVVDDSDQEELF